MTMLLPKQNRLRDPRYLKWVREQGHCLFTGSPEPDPHHILTGNLGRGIKPSDDLVIPLRHDLHMKLHDTGEIMALLDFCARHPLGPDALIAAFKVLARELYRERRET